MATLVFMQEQRWYQGMKVYHPVFLFWLSAFLISCSSMRPPQTCGIGGTANQDTFDQLFSEMLLYDETLGGSPRIDTEAGPTFAPAESPISIQIESFTAVEIRFCVEERKGGGEINFDEVRLVPEGKNIETIRGFPSGSYVLRVIHDDVLIRNLPFIVE